MLKERLEAKKKSLVKLQESFLIETKDIQSSKYEDNAINALLEMKRLKAEIAELELCLQIMEVCNEVQ